MPVMLESPTKDSLCDTQQMLEERVQVDRARLQCMISPSERAANPSELPTAEEFFTKVMELTGATITWPTRLKVEAKTKKDPYVKISGDSEQIKNAKELVLAILRTKQNRVTLKIDIPYTDHSHIIGRAGKNTQRVMRETGCHIHFPDSNKNREMDKSNQVSIAGPLHAVEKARSIIRSLAPLSIMFDMRNVRPEINIEELICNPALEQALDVMPDLNVVVRNNRATGIPHCLVRGSVFQQDAMVDACKKLTEYFFPPDTVVPFTVSFEVLPPQQPFVLGTKNSNVHYISLTTGATIYYPTESDASRGASTFNMTGPVKSILDARQFIIGLLPSTLMFDLHGDQGSTVQLDHIERESGLQLMVKYRHGTENNMIKTVTVKSSESNVNVLYAIRQRILGINEMPTYCVDYVKHTININELARRVAMMPSPMPHSQTQMSSMYSTGPMGPNGTVFGYGPPPSHMSSQSSLNVNNASSVMLSPATYIPPQFTQNYWQSAQYGGSHPFQYMAPSPQFGHPAPSPLHVISSGYASALSNCNSRASTNPSDTESNDQPESETVREVGETKTETPRNNTFNMDDSITPKNEPCVTLNPITMPSYLDAARKYPFATAPMTSSTPPVQETRDPSPHESPLANGLLKITQQMRHMGDSWKAPGAERASDYDTQKLRAQKALQQPLNGPRQLNDEYAGYYFSKTTPSEVLRNNKLQQGDAAGGQMQNKWHFDAVPEDEEVHHTWSSEPVSRFEKRNLAVTNYFETCRNSPFLDFDVEQVRNNIPALLSLLNLSQYEHLFAENEIDFETFLLMTDDDYLSINISTVGARIKLRNAALYIRNLEGKKAAKSNLLAQLTKRQ